MEQASAIFNTWYNNTSKLVKDWQEMTEKAGNEQKNIWNEAGRMQQQWMNSFQSMMQNMQSPFMNAGTANGMFGQNNLQDAFSNMLKSSDIYTRLMQMWQPVFQAMQNNTLQNQDLWKLIDPQQFRAFVDKQFGFDAVTPMKNFMDQSNQIMSLWMNSSAEAGKNFGQMFSNGMPFFNAFSQMNPQSMMNWYMEMMRSAQRSFAPFLGSTSHGTMPSMQPMLELMEQGGNYMTKLNQMQNMIYKTSASAWEKVMQTLADRTREGNAFTDFNQFYNEWSSINEKEFVSLFNTDEFASLQAELIKLNTVVNKTYEKQMEAVLQPFPVVFRSQLDEVYKVNHELRGRVNSLEKTVIELYNTIKTNAEEDGKASKKGK